MSSLLSLLLQVYICLITLYSNDFIFVILISTDIEVGGALSQSAIKRGNNAQIKKNRIRHFDACHNQSVT